MNSPPTSPAELTLGFGGEKWLKFSLPVLGPPAWFASPAWVSPGC
jgi:hypothetical protein